MAAAIQALCSSGFTSSLCNSFTLRHFAFSWRTRDDSPTPLPHALLSLKTLEKKNLLCFLCICMRPEKENYRIRTEPIPHALSRCYHKACDIMCNKSQTLLSRLLILYLFSNNSGIQRMCHKHAGNNAVKQRGSTGAETMTAPRIA